jgi:nickel-dependent lactate racemase
MIQAHKALEGASLACSDGGTIVLLAECADGLGRDDFLNWFEADSSEQLAERLCEKYQVNGQTAWSLMKKTERFDVRIVTELEDAVAAKLGLRKEGISEIATLTAGKQGYVLPHGAKFHISV